MEPQQEVSYALYNAGARTYNTNTGRWLQEDPLLGIPTDPMSFNRYLYCNADPVNNTDPTGLFPESRLPQGILRPPSASGSPANSGPNDLDGQDCPGYDPCANRFNRAVALLASRAGSTIIGGLGAAAGGSVGAGVGGTIGGGLGAGIGGTIGGIVGGAIGGPFGAIAGVAVGAVLGDAIGTTTGAIVGGTIGGAVIGAMGAVEGGIAGDYFAWGGLGHPECFDLLNSTAGNTAQELLTRSLR